MTPTVWVCAEPDPLGILPKFCLLPCRRDNGRVLSKYGTVKVDGRTVSAHRWRWEQAFGPIPDGMEVCHRCDNPPCVEIDHLFLADHAGNMMDMVAKGRGHGFVLHTHCGRGHEWAVHAYWYTASNGRRRRTCRECHRINAARYRAAH